MKKIFVTATGTEIGKTLISSSLIYQHLDRDIRFAKPVISGFELAGSDSALMLEAAGLDITISNINNISPWRFKDPLSPNIAARLENIELNFQDIVDFISDPKLNKNKSLVLVEGAGGLMSPITDNYTNLDLIKSINFEVILVSGTYLGAISHLLSAYEVLKLNQIKINQIILSESENTIDISLMLSTLKNFVNSKISFIPRINHETQKYKYVEKIYI